MTKTAGNLINPDYYKATLADGTVVEAVDLIIALGLDKKHLVASAMYYLFRLDRKGDEAAAIADLDKAIWYLQREKRDRVSNGIRLPASE